MVGGVFDYTEIEEMFMNAPPQSNVKIAAKAGVKLMVALIPYLIVLSLLSLFFIFAGSLYAHVVWRTVLAGWGLL